jgi:hypothetical protein
MRLIVLVCVRGWLCLQGCRMANLRRCWPKERVHGKKNIFWPIFGQFQTIVTEKKINLLIGQFVGNFKSNLIFCQVQFFLKTKKLDF